MSVAYQMAMPVIIYCLGGEMVYILCSRLKAQEIPEDKSIKVIHDVVQSLFEHKFIAELTKKKNTAKHQEVRQMFEKLAHSSIMRLNPTSMTKLFELMLMALKLQVLRAKYAEEIYKVTLNHLESVLSILIKQDPKGNSQIIEYVKEAIDKFNQNYKKLTPYDYIILRDTLLRFLQGKNVKVSIFIQESLQSTASTIYLPMSEVAPPYTNKPGIVKQYDAKGNVVSDDFFELKLSSDYIRNTNCERLNNFSSDFGLNMFSNEKKLSIIGKQNIKDLTKDLNVSQQETKPLTKEIVKKAFDIPSSKSTIKESTFLPQTDNSNQENNFVMKNNSEINRKMTEEQRKKITRSTMKEFKDLADLLSVPASNDAGTFKLDLFKSHINPNQGEEDEEEDYINIEIEKNTLKNKYEVCFNMIDKENANEADEDDLLDLMDKATK